MILIFCGLRLKKIPKPICKIIVYSIFPDIFFRRACISGDEALFEMLAGHVDLQGIYEWCFSKMHFKMFWHFIDKKIRPLDRNKNFAVLAAENGRLDMLKYFCEFDKTLLATHGHFMFWFACDYGQIEVVKFLVSSGFDYNASIRVRILTAIHKDFINMFQYLISLKPLSEKKRLFYIEEARIFKSKKILAYLC